MSSVIPKNTHISRNNKEGGRITSIRFSELEKQDSVNGVKPLSVSVRKTAGQPAEGFSVDAFFVDPGEADTVLDKLKNAAIIPNISENTIWHMNSEHSISDTIKITVNANRLEEVTRATKAMLGLSPNMELPQAFRDPLSLFSGRSKK